MFQVACASPCSVAIDRSQRRQTTRRACKASSEPEKGLWDVVADDPEIVAIRGPPAAELWPTDDLPPPEFDAVDEPAVDDWAA